MLGSYNNRQTPSRGAKVPSRLRSDNTLSLNRLCVAFRAVCIERPLAQCRRMLASRTTALGSLAVHGLFEAARAHQTMVATLTRPSFIEKGRVKLVGVLMVTRRRSSAGGVGQVRNVSDVGGNVGVAYWRTSASIMANASFAC